MDARKLLDDPPKQSRTPHVHNLHVRVPIPLWKRFRKSFPEKGDLSRVVLKSLELYLELYERKRKQTDEQ